MNVSISKVSPKKYAVYSIELNEFIYKNESAHIFELYCSGVESESTSINIAIKEFIDALQKFVQDYREEKGDIPPILKNKTLQFEFCEKSYHDFLYKSMPKDFFYPREGHKPFTGDVLVPEYDLVKNKDNPFYQKKIVISGVYDTWPDRVELAKLLKSYGADISTGISKVTNILCAGRDCGPSKLKKMNTLIEEGRDATILYEKDILEILNDLTG